MAKDRDILSSYLKHYPKIESDHLAAQAQLERDLSRLLNDYFSEVAHISDTYNSFEENHVNQYIQTEQDYQAAIAFINQEYDELFAKIDDDRAKHDRNTERLIAEENDQYQVVIDKISDIKKQSYQQYLEMAGAIHNQIDHEMKVHHDFLFSEDDRFDSIKHAYQEINSQQANKLLWTIEESKNALIALSDQLHATAIDNSKYMNESIMAVLESLRETKNKMTFLFKSTSDLFNKNKSRVERLGRDREKPHTQLNQSVIRQYVKQIRDVMQKKNTFESVIRRELKTSLAILGKRILRYDQENNRFETEKAIMQYEIVQKKSEYLLKRNQEMADLLISKYQSEIKKIKIDSFRRVEEIKLSYLMPAAFFQNSINLYSNFAFYVNESFDDLDNLLSELIRFNQRIVEVKSDYIGQSAKTVEDYKIQVMVRVNSVTTRLTDLIAKIDVLSKDIITLESRNQLEVAEIRKKMECADISGDYQKYVAELDNDEVFACFQHDINMQKLTSEDRYQQNLIALERSVTEIHHRQQLNVARQRELEKLSLHEKNIHDLAYDRELAEIDAWYDKSKLELSLREKIAQENQSFQFAKLNYQLANKYDQMRQLFLNTQQSGSLQVIDYIHKSQKLIDYVNAKVDRYADYTMASDSERDYAYYLERTRQKLIHHILADDHRNLAVNREAIQRIDHHFFSANQTSRSMMKGYVTHFQRLLLHLDDDFAVNQTNLLLSSKAYLTPVAYRIHAAYHNTIDAIQAIAPEHPSISSLRQHCSHHFERFVLLANTLVHDLSKPNRKPSSQRRLLEAFYVQVLELFNAMHRIWSFALDQSELTVLKADVLVIERHAEKSKAIMAMINQEYDRLIIKAIRCEKHKDRQITSMQKEANVIDTIIRKRVRRVNDTFEKAMAGEADKLAYMKKEIIKIIQDNLKALKMQEKFDQRRAESDLAALNTSYQNHVKAYQRLKAFTEETYAFDYKLISKNAEIQAIATSKALVAMDQQVVQLPNQSKELAVRLQSDKEALIVKRRGILLQQLTHIEGQKYTSRPKYVEEIEQVKKRLPDDYIALYKEIQKAEDEFLHEYMQTETAFSDDFSHFLKQQTQYRQIIDHEQVTQIPFEKYHAIATRLFDKTTANFQETIDKSALTMNLIKEQETKSKKTQDRIING